MENQRLVNFMNQELSNYFVMNVKLHRYHWFAKGHHFFHLHEKFQELYEMFAEDLDEIAERILMIGGRPLATMKKYLKEATLEEASADDEETEMVSQLLADLRKIATEMNENGIPLAEELRDAPTADLLTTLCGKIEKYIWMFDAYLREEQEHQRGMREMNEEAGYRRNRTDRGGENFTQH
ncbi:Dps family protein [Aciduricibacillus chroicocephali]|uniref:Dps family protein n=1 Tax=Aciduricibacillus chroicocephali TaxID=3054939 RepID=UPI003263C21D